MYKNTDVRELKGNDLKIIGKNIFVKNTSNLSGFLNIYAPWCNHCVKLSELYKELSTLFLNKFNFYSLDAENKKNFKIVDKLNIEYYPTLFLVNKIGEIKLLNIQLDKNKLICEIYNHIN